MKYLIKKWKKKLKLKLNIKYMVLGIKLNIFLIK